MPFQVSPGVNVSEIDLTTIVPAVSTTEGAIAGRFNWGPVGTRVLIDTEDTLAQQYSKPDSNNYEEWFSAADFLSYGNKLIVSRLDNEANNASSAGVGRDVKNPDSYEANYSAGVPGAGDWVAKYPGVLGNSLKVSTCQSSSAWESTITTANLVFQASNTIVHTTGANTTSDVTSLDAWPSSISVATVVSAGDLLRFANSTINFELSVASVNSTAIVLDTAPTQAQLGTLADTTAAKVSSATRRWEFFNYFDNAPGTSTYATTRNGSGDELHVAVVDEDGEWTGVAGTVIERFASVSRASNARSTDGASLYYKTVVNNQSSKIWWASHVDTMTAAGGVASLTYVNTGTLPTTASLSGGSDGSTPTDAQTIAAYDLFVNPEEVDISLILGADANQTVAIHLINNIAEVRKDCLVCISPEYADVVNNASYVGKEMDDTIAFRNTLPSSSYAVIDNNWKYRYDKYNDVYRYTPLNGDTAGLMVRTDNTRDPWFSPAGYNRGNVKNVIKLAYNATEGQRDQLYKKGINPVVTFPGQGTVLFGDKTMLSKPSAFDRINVRRLFIVLEKAISTASRFTLFEFNDAFTRSQFRNLVEPFLRDVQGRGGLTDFRVVCDETNNPGSVIDRNEFVGDIYLKPARSINYIQLNFVAVRTGVDFEEIVGSIN